MRIYENMQSLAFFTLTYKRMLPYFRKEDYENKSSSFVS